jgi:hypothetical protein
VALTSCFAACSSDDANSSSPEGGAETGGKKGTGGADSGAETGGSKSTGGKTSTVDAGSDASKSDSGATTDGGGDGGGDGGPTGPVALVKFCNNLRFGTTDVTFKLVIGTGSTAVTLEAVTGHCTPEVSLPCTAVGVGTGIAVDMFDEADETSALVEGEIDLVEGRSRRDGRSRPAGPPTG